MSCKNNGRQFLAIIFIWNDIRVYTTCLHTESTLKDYLFQYIWTARS